MKSRNKFKILFTVSYRLISTIRIGVYRIIIFQHGWNYEKPHMSITVLFCLLFETYNFGKKLLTNFTPLGLELRI